jgi:hypothetical protein
MIKFGGILTSTCDNEWDGFPVLLPSLAKNDKVVTGKSVPFLLIPIE